MMLSYGDLTGIYAEACVLFNNSHLECNAISKTTVTEIMKRFAKITINAEYAFNIW